MRIRHIGIPMLTILIGWSLACNPEPVERVETPANNHASSDTNAPADSTALPEGHPPINTPKPAAMEKAPSDSDSAPTPDDATPGTIVAAGVRFKMPTEWKEQTPSSGMRLAQFALPATTGDAELLIHYFGPNGAGPRDANVQRWIGQFHSPDGGEVPFETNTEKRDGLLHTTVRAQGTFAPMSMNPDAAAPDAQTDYALVGVILEEGPKGPVYIKITGPKATIDAHADAINAFLASARAAE